ncbi:MAG: HGGxSTG domain-containing protein [bacterium]|nr:HGGxSTG domain-containing protein [bacterium]
MLANPRCGAKTRSGKACRAPAVNGEIRCRMHGGPNGAPGENRNARKHRMFTLEAIAERKRMQALPREALRVLGEME